MKYNIKPCEECGKDTSFERFMESLPHEGERATCCDRWVCVECIDWRRSDEANMICKKCVAKK